MLVEKGKDGRTAELQLLSGDRFGGVGIAVLDGVEKGPVGLKGGRDEWV